MLATQITFPTAPGGDHTLYASPDPALNLATIRAQQMTPEELYSAGFSAGFDNRGMRGSLSDYPEYCNGYSAGRRAQF